MRERGTLEQAIGSFSELEQKLEDSLVLLELGEAEEDEASVREAEGQPG